MGAGQGSQTLPGPCLISHPKESAGFYLGGIFCMEQLFIFTAHVLDKQNHFIPAFPRDLPSLSLQKKPFLLLGIAAEGIIEV